MPFAIAGNVERFDQGSLRKIEKSLGIILSNNQPALQQKKMIYRGLIQKGGVHHILETLSRKELLSLIFIITQFGDTTLHETPSEYTELQNIPYVVEWKKHHYTIPLEIMEMFSSERLFKEQGYLFAMIPSLSKDEKKAWIKWMGIDFEPGRERNLDFEIYYQCRYLQKPFQGKSLIQDSEFLVQDLWPVGKCEELDWFYKGLTTFYYALQELSRRERDPFKKHVLDVVKSGKFVLKRQDRYRPVSESALVATVEGSTPQLRETVFQWEREEKDVRSGLF
ncbi:hypothetical protein [Leptospira sp. GIMC2001]|uniref:hypothetical protein n=1 Tax=Leptospira sp. GIMC2001 TaxID=1513297 RepID=UPI002349097B|nr:hypothetical protein [Leptospira sp. GIMC2001]WCL49076.1 hypothetical protein O4O04_17570 [Leptospira sp. GIMC2001]